MTQKQFCIYATTAVGTIGGIILAPAIGPLALGLPLLMGLYGKKMAEVEGLDDEEEDNAVSLPRQTRANSTNEGRTNPETDIRELFQSARSPIKENSSVFTSNTNKHRSRNRSTQQRGLKEARGIPDNETYLRRHGGGD
jgi:hypothetical protein